VLSSSFVVSYFVIYNAAFALQIRLMLTRLLAFP
jgi:hypothetical protein